ncbi:MAG: glycoside hydrolase family 92 protein [Clostridia bacterium]|nr:glycoside hydrolase family 92 protein [Clostridia bacterium]
MDLCKYVNVFQGCGEVDIPKREGIAAKWFFIKAGCGNTSPAAMVPYGAMSAAPYSGGYPTGYGNHIINTHSHPKKFEGGEKLRGFAHIQQSGTGTMGYYYNYALTTPFYKGSDERRLPKDEKAEAGYYTCTLDDIKCELTASNRVALHRYTFGEANGFVKVDFKNNGINIPDYEIRKVYDLSIEKIDSNTAIAKAKIEGIDIFFAVKGNSEFEIKDGCAIFSLNEQKVAEISVSISLRSCEKALKNIALSKNFDETKADANALWNKSFSTIKIDASDEIKEIFYSNFYHSLVKPADWSGESFIYDGDGPFIADFSTLWDMYKTQLPLIFMTDKEMSEKIVETLLKVGEELGHIPNSFGLTDKYLLHNSQARMLGVYALITAYRYGIDVDPDRMLKVIDADVFSDNKTDFTVDGKCESHTWMLDMADGCALAAQIALERGNTEIYNRLYPLSLQWKGVYDPETGLLNEDSSYYEGTLYNYSFRQMVKMDERIELAGGKENFVKLLDKFFGYGQPDTVLATDPDNYEHIREGIKLGRFEGFNNESDTEAPFSYIYAGRHDRVCEIIRGGLKYMFSTGKGGLPGNNDSGALSSYYVMTAIGLFPVAGQDLFLIGSPVVDSAEVTLSSGNKLSIKVIDNSDENIYVKSVTFNGKEIESKMLSAKEIMSGGEMVFTMSDRA